jgi:hypothetical protein
MSELATKTCTTMTESEISQGNARERDGSAESASTNFGKSSEDASVQMSFHPCTMRDVAGLAGVSTATVSRALNCSGNVSPETRTKVLHAISQLKYCPDPYAAELGRRPKKLNAHVSEPARQ